MHLTIFRHGQAGPAARDSLRELTSTGRDEVSRGVLAMREYCRSADMDLPGLVLFSDWRRTTQTADIITEALSQPRQEPCSALVPGRGVDDVCAALDQLMEAGQEGHLLLVSHQPLVSMLVDYLLGDPGRVPPLSPGGLAMLELEAPGPGCATLTRYMLPPHYEAHL
ncbi:hypothetical protein F0M18_18960 [Pseudohalioglobus sediminis]|uniref:Phosphohistidine phosphatase SixA n=1 Tax=Pseudohalioglobus sediminis TaxID=2606449 RepID=A0A5B0WMC6_9GAMM|nr:hypothetical protein [Pseudohalioglobus sediminis]KAA1188122.1 hypothetical protein F0M18_18960 [Pseudohalioglobus sediminis]